MKHQQFAFSACQHFIFRCFAKKVFQETNTQTKKTGVKNENRTTTMPRDAPSHTDPLVLYIQKVSAQRGVLTYAPPNNFNHAIFFYGILGILIPHFEGRSQIGFGRGYMAMR